MPPGFDPKSGSVRPKQPSLSPFAIAGSHWSFCSSLPNVIDGIHHQRRLHAHERAHAAVAALELLRDQPVFDVGHAGAAVALEIGAEEAEIAHRLDQLAGEASVAIALLDDGDEIVFDELARGIAHQALVVGEQRIEADEIDSAEREGRHAWLSFRQIRGKHLKVAEPADGFKRGAGPGRATTMSAALPC